MFILKGRIGISGLRTNHNFIRQNVLIWCIDFSKILFACRVIICAQDYLFSSVTEQVTRLN